MTSSVQSFAKDFFFFSENWNKRRFVHLWWRCALTIKSSCSLDVQHHSWRCGETVYNVCTKKEKKQNYSFCFFVGRGRPMQMLRCECIRLSHNKLHEQIAWANVHQCEIIIPQSKSVATNDAHFFVWWPKRGANAFFNNFWFYRTCYTQCIGRQAGFFLGRLNLARTIDSTSFSLMV